jgi:hypothetical protein
MTCYWVLRLKLLDYRLKVPLGALQEELTGIRKVQ